MEHALWECGNDDFKEFLAVASFGGGSLGGAPKNIFCKQYDVGRNRAKPTTDFLMYAGETKSAHVCLLICCVFSVFWTADLICACFVFLSSVCFLSVVFFLAGFIF